jgi:flagellar basal body P-ring formation protein FlgA
VILMQRLSPTLVLTALAALLAPAMGQVDAQQPAARKVAVATHALARGAVLGAGDFTYRDTTVRFSLDTNTVAAGWVTRRVIAAGEVLRVPAVEAPTLVSANQPVELEYEDQNVRLTVRGTATRRGSMGERVEVRTEQGRRMEGVVVAPGRVRIG